jgi:hypothetical protein
MERGCGEGDASKPPRPHNDPRAPVPQQSAPLMQRALKVDRAAHAVLRPPSGSSTSGVRAHTHTHTHTRRPLFPSIRTLDQRALKVDRAAHAVLRRVKRKVHERRAREQGRTRLPRLECGVCLGPHEVRVAGVGVEGVSGNDLQVHTRTHTRAHTRAHIRAHVYDAVCTERAEGMPCITTMTRDAYTIAQSLAPTHQDARQQVSERAHDTHAHDTSKVQHLG